DRSIEATREAMAAWSGTVGAPDLEERALDAESPTAPGFDRKNGVFFMRDGYAPAGRALAVTILTYDNATGRILDADIVFNGAYTFEVLPEDVHEKATRVQADAYPTATDGIAHEDANVDRGAVYDLHHVVAHELGHSVGMNDEMDRDDALMYRYSAPNDPSLRSPADDDIAG